MKGKPLTNLGESFKCWKPRLYVHYKGGLYLLLFYARNAGNPDELWAVYLGIPSLEFWVRPISEFHDIDVQDGEKLVERFRYANKEDFKHD